MFPGFGGARLVAVDGRTKDQVTDGPPDRLTAGPPEVPHGACYLQLPERLFWARIDDTTAPEPLDWIAPDPALSTVAA